MSQGVLGKGFKYTGTRLEHLGATEYTLVTIAVDDTGSVSPFADQLLEMLKMSVLACKKSPRSDNIMVRVIRFSNKYAGNIDELHGFKPLSLIDPQTDYALSSPGGGTPLYDAAYSVLGATNAYAKNLVDQDFGVNAIVFIITDGGDNTSIATKEMVKNESRVSVNGEVLESMISVLIGVNTAESYVLQKLNEFKNEAELTHFIDANDATPGNLAKLATFVSRSISSQSQALGTGGASQVVF
jgi:uncharacterized protein YegL